jgi:peroxiredoxin
MLLYHKKKDIHCAEWRDFMFLISIGPFSFHGPLLLWITFGAAGFLAIRYRFARHPSVDRIRSAFFTGSVLWLLVWKGSLVVIDLPGVIAAPSSLLYFDGGVRGQWAASLIALVWVAISLYRAKLPAGEIYHLIGVYCLFGHAAYRIATAASGRLGWLDASLLYALAACALYGMLYQAWHRKIPRGRWATQAILLGAVTVLLVSAIAEQSGARKAPGLGEAGQALTLETADGQPIRLSDFTGSVVVLNFWATWCPPCRAEMPSMQLLHERIANSEAAVLAVNVTATERDTGAASRFMKEREFTLPLALDPTGETMKAYNIRAYPTTYVLDRKGIVHEIFEGAVHHAVLEDTIREILATQE